MADPVRLLVVTAEETANLDAIEALENLLELAKKGEIQEVMAVGSRSNGNYITVVTPGLSHLQRIGILETMKFDLMDNREAAACP